MIVDRFPLFDSINTPQEDSHAVEECDDSHHGKCNRRGEGDAVAEIEECCSDGAEDDGEFELGSFALV